MMYKAFLWSMLLGAFIAIPSGANVMANVQSDLSVTLTTTPAFGAAPLQGVDLTAQVFGGGQEDILYQFDCTGDGTWDNIVVSLNENVTVFDACDYFVPGIYVAIVQAVRGEVKQIGTVPVRVDAAAQIFQSVPTQTQFVSTQPAAIAPTLSSTLTAAPATGIGSLSGVALTGRVFGTATGDILYNFDCTNDGTWDHTVISLNEIFTAFNICNYSAVGTYIARAQTTRAGITSESFTTIGVAAPVTQVPTPILTPIPTPVPTTTPDQPIPQPLVVELLAEPAVGLAPLRDVTLVTRISGSLSNQIAYKFDCTNDGTPERQITAELNHRAEKLCTYAAPGTYTAKVEIVSLGRTAQATTSIRVQETPQFALNVSVLAKNLTKKQTVLGDPVFASPKDVIEYEAIVSAGGSQAMRSVVVKLTLNQELKYIGNAKIDGVATAMVDLVTTGFNLGDLAAGQAKVITFQAQVADNAQAKDVFATLLAYNTEKAATDTVTARVSKAGVSGATLVATGALGTGLLAFALTLGVLLLLSYLYFVFFYISRKKVPAFATKAERDLQSTIAKIKQRENFLL